MARKKKKEYAAVVGLVGSAKVSMKAAKAHLTDFIERFSEEGEILWVLPDTEDATKSLEAVKDFLWEEDANYALVSDGTAEDEDWHEHAKAVVTVEDGVYAALVTEVSGYKSEMLAVIFLLDEEHDGDLELLDAALGEELKCYDLTAGLNELELADEDEPEAAEDAEEGEESEEEEEPETEDDAEDAPSEPAVIPDDIQALIDKGKVDQASAKLVEAMDREQLVEIADELGVEGVKKKGGWAKTIAKQIVTHLAPEDEEEAEEEAPKPKKATKKSSTTSKPAAKTEKAAEPSEEPAPEDTTSDDVEVAVAAARAVGTEFEMHYRVELLRSLSHVAAAQNAAEAGKFIDVLKKANLA